MDMRCKSVTTKYKCTCINDKHKQTCVEKKKKNGYNNIPLAWSPTPCPQQQLLCTLSMHQPSLPSAQPLLQPWLLWQMLQLLLLPVNKNGNHCHSVSKCCPHNVDASSNQDLWQHMKMGNGQFSPLDQINGTVKMSKRYKYLWCACQFSCLAQVQCLLIENFDIKFYLRPSLRTWGRRFPWLL